MGVLYSGGDTGKKISVAYGRQSVKHESMNDLLEMLEDGDI